MFKSLLVISLLGTQLFSINIDSLVKIAYEKNIQLSNLKREQNIRGIEIQNSSLYKNPRLGVGFTDISLDTPTKRNLEPMQTNFISISQEIISSDKIDIKKKLAQSFKLISDLKVKDEMLLIKKAIYEIAFKIDSLDKKLLFLDKKSVNINRINSYLNNHIDNKNHLNILLRNQLLLEQINLNTLNLKEKKSQLFSKLEETTLTQVESIEFNFNLNDEMDKSVDSNYQLKIANQLIDIAKLSQKYINETKYPNYTISAGYYQRESFDDYLNISLSFPLTIYGKESNDMAIASEKFNISQNRYQQIKNTLADQYRVETSKYNIAISSLEINKNIKSKINSELELLKAQNDVKNIMKIYELRNKHLDFQINDVEYFKDKNLALVKLKYLTSTL